MGICKPIGLLATKQERLFFPAKLIIRGVLIMFLFLGLFVLALISGMLGLGVAFAAVPFLGFFFEDLVHQVQPISLLCYA